MFQGAIPNTILKRSKTSKFVDEKAISRLREGIDWNQNIKQSNDFSKRQLNNASDIG